MMQRWQMAGFGLYIHWPFCLAKCPYCDFNSHVAARIDQDLWADAYIAELHRVAQETQGRRLSSIFFGGGTPSLMDPRTVERIVTNARDLWVPANDIEITLEANPTSVEAGRFVDFRSAGINRVSVGIQALNDADLRRLGRMHSADEGRKAIEIAQTVFQRSSFDLIYARQDQSLEQWRQELSEALRLAEGHLSLYQLTIEPDTVFGERHQRGQLRGLPVEDTSVDMYLLTQELCEAAGRPAYEVSNHAAEGEASRHNMIYWRAGDYLGIGPGAHGRITNAAGQRMATFCPKAPGAWLNRVRDSRNGEDARELLDRAAIANEYLIMGMRLVSGIDPEDYRAVAGHALDPRAIADLVDLGFLIEEPNRIAATLSGRLILNAVIEKLSR
jgi:putative oxygen-independent coproporphyrinogen III oxidase